MTPLLSWYRSCWDYWGGCEPSTLDVAIRAIAAAFGFGPEFMEVALFLVALVFLPALAVTTEPLPDTWLSVSIRVVVGVATVGVFGHGGNLLRGLEIPTSVLLFIASAFALVALGMLLAEMYLRLRRLMNNIPSEWS